MLLSTEFLEIFPPCCQITRNKGGIFQVPLSHYNLHSKYVWISEPPGTRGVFQGGMFQGIRLIEYYPPGWVEDKRHLKINERSRTRQKRSEILSS